MKPLVHLTADSDAKANASSNPGGISKSESVDDTAASRSKGVPNTGDAGDDDGVGEDAGCGVDVGCVPDVWAAVGGAASAKVCHDSIIVQCWKFAVSRRRWFRC